LSDCLDSLLDQNIEKSEYEIVCIDDGSSDGSYNILLDYQEKNSNVVVFRKENGGVSSARNIGIDIAKGKYLWFVDSDDYIKSNCLKTIKEIIDTHEVPLIRLKLMSVESESRYRRMVGDFTFLIEDAASTSPNVLTSIYRKDIIINNHIKFNEEMKYAEDTLFSYYFYMASERKHAIIDEVLYFYRDNPSSVMHAKNLDALNRHCLDLIKLGRIYKSICELDEIQDERKKAETARRQSEAIQEALWMLPQTSFEFNDIINDLKKEKLYPYKRTSWKIKEANGIKEKIKAFLKSWLCVKGYCKMYCVLKRMMLK